MRTKSLLRPALLVSSLLISVYGQAQVTTANNFPPSGSYVGSDVSITDPLEIRHNGNEQIQWYTDAIQRMMLNESAAYTIGGSPVQADGSLLLCPDVSTFVAPGPYTRLHLADGIPWLNNSQGGYRSWMKNGITMTGNGDQMYVGQLYRAEDYPDATITWSDNPGSWKADRLTFNFTGGYTQGAEGCSSLYGIQTLVVQPAENCTEAFVGIGDFDAASAIPVERLDVLDGRLRIRELPEASGQADAAYKVMVVDDAASPSGERGVVKWVNATDLPGGGGSGTDCDWAVQNPTTSGVSTPHHVTTAVGSSTICPDDNDNVGIGELFPTAKLHVKRTSNSGNLNRLSRFEINGTDSGKYAVQASAEGTGAVHVAFLGTSVNGSIINTGGQFQSDILESTNWENRGIRSTAEVKNSSTSTNNHAAHFHAFVDPSSTATTNYGARILANVQGGSTTNYGILVQAVDSGGSTISYGIHAKALGSNDWSAYFVGRTYHSSGTWITSDEQFKTNVQELESPLAKLLELVPRTYQFNTGSYGFMGFDDTPQIGLLAANVEAVFPELIAEVHHPEQYSDDGEVINPAMDFKAVNYTGMIPVLIGAVKQQQQQLSTMQTQIADLQQALASCCSRNAPTGGSMEEPADDKDLNDTGSERILRIDPNPFTEQTTIRYTLERGGRAMLMLNSSDGKQLQVLHEGAMEKGEYSRVWNTTQLAPGTYYLTLLLDGEPLVKRAVKL